MVDVYVLNRDFETVAIIDAFISEIWTDRFWEPGDFEIKVAASKEALDIFKQDYYLVKSDSDHVMIIEDVTLDSDAEDGATILVEGRSLESILDRRIIWGQKNISGNLQNSIKSILNAAMINPTTSSRKIKNLTFKESTDPNITKLTADGQYTGTSVLEVVEDLCQTADIGFRITMPVDGSWVFELYTGVDRTYDQDENPYIIFSPNYENLMNSNSYSSKRDYRTVALVAGEGDGSSETRVTVSSESGSGSGLDRRELYVEASDVSKTVDGEELTDSQYQAKLKQRGKEELNEHKITTTFDGEAETSRSFKYGVDFKMGDVVQNENEYGQTFTSRITEYIWSQDDSEVKEYPTFTVIEQEGGSE